MPPPPPPPALPLDHFPCEPIWGLGGLCCSLGDTAGSPLEPLGKETTGPACPQVSPGPSGKSASIWEEGRGFLESPVVWAGLSPDSQTSWVTLSQSNHTHPHTYTTHTLHTESHMPHTYMHRHIDTRIDIKHTCSDTHICTHPTPINTCTPTHPGAHVHVHTCVCTPPWPPLSRQG